MSGQNKVSGVVLAGGMGRRMGLQDKGLMLFNDRPLVQYSLAAMQPLVDELLISANRNQDAYRTLGYRVIGDAHPTFDGPLAGILAAMQEARNPLLLVMPCDSPLVKTAELQRLLTALQARNADIAVVSDGERLHPVFLALKTALQADLQDYLQQGGRKLESWLQRHTWVAVDFSDQAEVFANINSPEELLKLERTGFSRAF